MRLHGIRLRVERESRRPTSSDSFADARLECINSATTRKPRHEFSHKDSISAFLEASLWSAALVSLYVLTRTFPTHPDRRSEKGYIYVWDKEVKNTYAKANRLGSRTTERSDFIWAIVLKSCRRCDEIQLKYA